MATGPATPNVFRFGSFELNARTGELRKDGFRIKLAGQPIAILAMLLDRPGDLVTREELQKKLWPSDTFVDFEHSLNTAIKRLRAALNDSADTPRYVETLPGRGYRFIGETNGAASASPEVPVEAGQSPAAPVVPAVPTRSYFTPWYFVGLAVLLALAIAIGGRLGWQRYKASPSPAARIRSLAVLPLENLSGDPSQEYFADGMTDALITDLAQINALKVISRTSALRYKATKKSLPEIAQELHVDGIVEGSVVRVGDRVRITAQLIDAHADQHLWAATYERGLRDVLSLQDEVARDIAGEIRVKLTARERERFVNARPIDPEAYQLYLEGRYHWNQRTPSGIKRSLELFQKATEKDPNFALAYVGLADAYNVGNNLGVFTPEESMRKAKAAAANALVLDPRLGEAHAVLGQVKSHYDFDFPGAQREYLKAIELNPSYANAYLYYAGGYLTPMRRHAEAIAEMKKALELDPLSSLLNSFMGMTYLLAGDYEKSVLQLQHTIDLDPTFPLAHFFLASALTEIGNYEQVIAEMEKGTALSGVSPEEVSAVTAEFRTAFRAGGPNGYWQRNLQGTLRQHEHGGAGTLDVAGAYARVGDKEKSLEWLQKAYEERNEYITLVNCDPDYKSLHGDPRFSALLKRIGLPD